MINFYPTTEVITELEGRRSNAISLYKAFYDKSDWSTQWCEKIITELRNEMNNQTTLDSTKKKEILERVRTEIEDTAISRPHIALFIDDSGIWVFNTYSRMNNKFTFNNHFNIKQLFRTVSNPRKGYVVTVSRDSWNIHRFDGPKAPELAKLDKENYASFEDYIGEARDKHIQQKSKADLENEHLKRYAGQIAHVVSKICERDHTLIIGEATLAGDVRARLNNPNVELHPVDYRTVNVEEEGSKFLDNIFRDSMEKDLERVYGLIDDGYSITDVSDLARAIFEGNIDSLYVSTDYSVYGTYDDELGSITFEGDDSLMNKFVSKARDIGSKIFIVRDDEITYPHWNGTFVALKRWV